MTTLDKIAGGFGLLEGPVWDSEIGILFADAQNGGVYALNEEGTTCVVAHRRGIGGMVRHSSGGLIVSGRNVALKAQEPGSTVVLLDNDYATSGLVGFSDMCADPAGRLLAGMLGSRPTESKHLSEHGSLWLIELDGSARCIIEAPKVLHTNGLAFSPDNQVLYYADSAKRSVFAYDYDTDLGQVGHPRLFTEMPEGIPDGLAVASDGSVWIANAFAGRVAVVDSAGHHQHSIDVPESIVTNVCFGGSRMDEVYITTGSLNPSERIGSVYRMTSTVPGLVPFQAQCSIRPEQMPPSVTPPVVQQ
ncbi:SMP-30/gluconolactonase/LRE family protein [Rhodococcus sp. UNC23MFCrub1.1]|uniref:SMP-30/gluconolactonase/LRE family protein n=1 Tax=Rhodococcus sp. UNC23MFCrub1.1 TaxID=1449068 RepID=UPI0018CC7201|nr:SMP-30/gluconolactonase/LRE family protein [Rhodococcus sp. UNC23MFCrub1.1]